MQKRALTINFQRSVTAGKPNEMEVAVAPLSEPNAPASDATLVGGPQTQTILLANENNPVVFELVPTDHPDLTTRVVYRIAWREKYMGRQFTKDFVMPDFDVDYDDLEDLGSIIGGETYIQWSDRSHPGGVAGLNDQGQVIDSEGNVVSGAESAAIVQGKLDVEEAEFRDLGDPLLRYLRQLTADPDTVALVVMPELVFSGPQRLLHSQRALYIKRLLLFEPRVILTSVPYQLLR